MVRIYTYNDIKGFDVKLHNVKSNLCTFYYKDKGKFCGNYCSRNPPHGFQFNKRCWRHKRPKSSTIIPPVILLMISASDRTYNRDTWLNFVYRCQKKNVPLELVMYHEDMNNCTVRNPQNLISRFRPFPDIFGPTLPLRDLHGSVNFSQVVFRMLEYGCLIPNASRCIVLTERTIPIRSPLKIYQTAMSLKCYINISYNVAYDVVPDGIPPQPRGKPYSGVNNLCQGLYTVDFLREALPTVALNCKKFGISLNNRVYSVTNSKLFEQWKRFTGANPCEFWLLNSFLLQNINKHRPIDTLKRFMTAAVEKDVYIVSEIPQWRDDWKRTFIFKSLIRPHVIPRFDARVQNYYNGLDFSFGISLIDVIHFIRKHKKRAMFFRQVELP